MRSQEDTLRERRKRQQERGARLQSQAEIARLKQQLRTAMTTIATLMHSALDAKSKGSTVELDVARKDMDAVAKTLQSLQWVTNGADREVITIRASYASTVAVDAQ